MRSERMSLRPIVLGAVLLLWTPAAWAQSLWVEGASGGRLFADHRARGVNDIVTILIVESSSSSRSATTKSEESTSRTSAVNQFPTLLDPVARKVVKPFSIEAFGGYEKPSDIAQNRLGLNLSGSASHEGKGSIDRSDKVSGSIAARVVKVLDNGNLVVEGRRDVLVNDETQVITISGVVRPQDVTSANTVLSTQVADAEVQMVGRGILAEAQRPGIIYRLLDWLRLF
jgi:flagellar L-ring protein precursor FlgH